MATLHFIMVLMIVTACAAITEDQQKKCQDDCVEQKNNDSFRHYSYLAKLNPHQQSWYCLCHNVATPGYCALVCGGDKNVEIDDGKCVHVDGEEKTPCEP